MTLIENINRARELAGMKPLSEAQSILLKESPDEAELLKPYMDAINRVHAGKGTRKDYNKLFDALEYEDSPLRAIVGSSEPDGDEPEDIKQFVNDCVDYIMSKK